MGDGGNEGAPAESLLAMERATTPARGSEAGEDREGDATLTLDLLRGELYRLLDELARAGSEAQGALLEELQDTLERFRGELALRGRAP